MGKENRIATKDKEYLQYKKRVRKIRKITAIVTFSVIGIILVGFLAFLKIYNDRLDRGDYLRGEIAASSRHNRVDGAMMNYYLNDVYLTFAKNYGSYFEAYGLDTKKPIATQYMADGRSWYDYFMERAKANVTAILLFADDAVSHGVSLDEAEKQAILLRCQGMDAREYGRGVSVTDIYNAKLIEALAGKYRRMKEAEFSPSVDEINLYYKENEKSLLKADYYSFSIFYDISGESSEGRLTKSDALNLVNMFSDTCDKDNFEDTVRKILKMQNPKTTDEQIEQEIKKLENTEALYVAGDELSEWLFSEKAGSVFKALDEENGVYTVYLLTREPYRNQSKTVNVKHILFSDEYYGGRDKARAGAEQALKALEESKDKEALFELLALQYSCDTSTYYLGGEYENIKAEYMTEILANWCFSHSRQEGDFAMIESEVGCHVMYYEGEGLCGWQAEISGGLISKATNEYINELMKTNSVIFDERIIDMIPDPGA